MVVIFDRGSFKRLKPLGNTFERSFTGKTQCFYVPELFGLDSPELAKLISISVRYLVNFSIVTGKKTEDLLLPEDSTLKDLLDELIERYGDALGREVFYPGTEEVKAHVLILLNGRSLDQFREKLDTLLGNGDSVIFTFPVTGG